MQYDLSKNPVFEARPFLKWAGGKKQLIETIESRIPDEIKSSMKIDKYFEPFVGGGALFFYLMSNYQISEAYIYDINRELILTYNAIKNNPNELIEELKILSDEYIPKGQDERKIQRAAYTIFMNKTCFNGLFRLNSKMEFNVPHGRYKKPLICDEENIRNVSHVLQHTTIVCGSFLESEDLIDDKSLVYLDPPYRPISNTSNFNTYAGNDFNDDSQRELGEYYKRISNKGAKAILSNSDPKNVDENDNFFDDIYADYTIERVYAKRSINSNASKRGAITEILVRNY